MTWKNIKLITSRELRDQLRDRRTLFMIAVLPILLYPLMGMTFLQVTQFLQEHPTKILILGSEHLPADPPLLDDQSIRSDLFSSTDRQRLLEVELVDEAISQSQDVTTAAQRAIDRGVYDAIIYFPPGFDQELQEHLQPRPSDDQRQAPHPEIFFSTAKDQSRIAYERVSIVLRAWRAEMVERNLQQRAVPATAAEPFVMSDIDVAEPERRRAAVWSKILPFVLIVWALTGAFYPAIDLCAGEKERGTLETLLSSPAERVEIVWGKLITVMIFSMATSLLNLTSLILTASVIIGRVQLLSGMNASTLGAPPISTLGWLIVALIPLAALFSAMAMAMAAMARSTKEGQYYLMPLLLVTMPLAMLPIMPATEISLGNSLIPVTGVMLLLRSLIEGEYLVALKYLLPVVAVTAGCCTLAIRWAVQQFNDESVLFREGERFELRLWLRHLVRDRSDTPTTAEAFMCGILLLMLQFFIRLWAPVPDSWHRFAIVTLTVQIAFILSPVLLMTVVLTARPRLTLLLNWPRVGSIFVALLLAVCLHPAATAMRDLIQQLYPISEQTLAQLGQLSYLIADVPIWQVLILLAFVPAIVEELAFRGFLLSGFRHLGHKGMAIIISSIFFGVVHGILQQSLNATLLGLILGYIAVQSGSLLPCMIFHAIHNALQLLAAAYFTPDFLARNPRMGHFLVESSQLPSSVVYSTPVVIGSVIASGVLLYWFRTLPFTPTPEEKLQDALDHQISKAATARG